MADDVSVSDTSRRSSLQMCRFKQFSLYSLLVTLSMLAFLVVSIIVVSVGVSIYQKRRVEDHASGTQTAELRDRSNDSSSGCRSGRLLFSGIPMELHLQVHRNGIYIEQPRPHRGRPFFKHEYISQYIYYRVSKRYIGYWVVASADNRIDVRVRSMAIRPEAVIHVWRVRAHKKASWRPLVEIRAVCVKESFVTCTSGKLQLSGFSRFNRRAEEGTYSLMNYTSQMRPVYCSQQLRRCLFYRDDQWRIEEKVSELIGGSFVTSNAIRPEYITQTWWSLSKWWAAVESAVSVTCQPQTVQVQGEPSCPRTCSNHGQCTMVDDKRYICDCDDGYIGPHCERRLSCGLPAQMPHGHVKVFTGMAFLSLAFYGCEAGYAPVDTNAVVCGADGAWSHPQYCSAGDFSNSPSHTMFGPWGRK